MKKIQLRVSSLVARVCALGLAAFGLASCGAEYMYGSPEGTFEIKGMVTAESDGSAVAGATITVKNPYRQLSEPVLTDDNGNYSNTGEVGYDKVRVVCTPTDDSGLAADSVDVDLKFGGKKHDDWDMGHAESTVNFKLKAKPTGE